MKKEEALQIAPEKSRVLMEVIEQILNDKDRINGKITISKEKTDKGSMCYFHIYVQAKNYIRHWDTGIGVEQIDILTEQILNDLADNFLESETMGCTKYYTIRGGYGMNMDGISAKNSIGSNIEINFAYRGNQFMEQIQKYNAKLDEYVQKQNERRKL